MLEGITQGFKSARNKLRGKAEITESGIQEALNDVRLSLLEADVALPVVKSFLETVKASTLGSVENVRGKGKDGSIKKRSPADIFVKACYDELVSLMGPEDSQIALPQGPATLMMVGLQGTGKTTTTAKLAKHFIKQGRKPMLVGADIYRPAAIEQLRVLGEQLGIPVHADPSISPPELCAQAKQKAKEWQRDLILLDTAGRLAIDDELMAELASIKERTRPDSILLVADAMMGQDAVRTSLEFDQKLSIDGFIMTKLDGDARGGAALSIKAITGKPIKFLGMGEKLDNLEAFRPEGLASRILGMGDIVGLVQDFEEHVDMEDAEQDAERMLSGKFTFDDFLKQIQMMRKMGSISSLLEKLPGMGDMMPAGAKVDDNEFVKLEAMVQSMTPAERKRPKLIEKSASRQTRIAKGSGRSVQELKDLVQRFNMMKQMMQAVGMQPGLMSRLPGFKDIAKMMGGGGIGLPQGLMPGGNASSPNLAAMEQMMGGGRGGPLVTPPGYYSPPSSGANKPNASAKRKKRKAQRKARKKNRR